MMEPTGAVKRTGGKAAVAAFASAALLLPAELADGATRISKKFGKWAATKANLDPKEEGKLERLLERNERKLRQRIRRNPDAILQAKPEPLVIARDVQRKKGQRGNWRSDRASASQFYHCGYWLPAAHFQREHWAPPNSPEAIYGVWSSVIICGSNPRVLVGLNSDMKDPSGRHHKARDVGLSRAGILGAAHGPKGTWNWQNKAQLILPPGWSWGPGGSANCAGIGTKALTCVAPKVYPI